MTCPKRKEPLPWREIDGRAVILNPQVGEVHEMDPVATFLWNQINGTRTVDELAHAVVESFDVEFSRAIADTREFVTALGELGLLA